MQTKFSIGQYWLSQPPSLGGAYFATWKDGSKTRRRSLGTRDFSEAKKGLARFVVEHGDTQDARALNPTLGRVVSRYFLGHAIDTASAEATQHNLQRWIDHFGADMMVNDLTPQNVAHFLRELARGRSESYVNRVARMMRAALNWCHRRGEIDVVPYFELPPSGESRKVYLSAGQVAQLLDACEEEHQFRFLILMLLLAARPIEVLELTSECIRDGVIDTNPPGRRQTKKRRPILPISETLAGWLRVWNPQGHVVTYQGQPIQRMSKGFRMIRRRAGVPEDVTAYALRHTAATVMRSKGVNPWEVSGWLGHSTGNTTDIYAHFDPQYLRDGARALDAFFDTEELRPFRADGVKGRRWC